MLKHEIIEPRSGVFANDGLIVMPNEIMAGLGDYHAARAQDVADATGAAVLAYQRPFSASSYTFNLGLRRHSTGNAAGIRFDTALELDSLIAKETSLPVYMTGHSAGATEGIGITATEVLSVAHGVFTDPVAVRKGPPLISVPKYVAYRLIVERKKPKECFADVGNNCEPALRHSGWESFVRTTGEICTYSAFWRGDASREALFYIRDKMPNTGLDVYFPEHTFTSTPDQLWELCGELNGHRANFNARMVPGQYHSYFDDYKRFARLVARVLAVGKRTNLPLSPSVDSTYEQFEQQSDPEAAGKQQRHQ